MLLGFECSGSRSHGVLTSASGRIVARCVAPAVTEESSLTVFTSMLSHLRSHLQPGERPTLVMALPHRPDDRAALRALFDTADFWFASPFEAMTAGALAGRPGAVVLSGTNAAVMAAEPSGRFLLTAEDDEILGTEGSGLWLSVRSVRLAMQGQAGCTFRSERLEQALRAFFGVSDLAEVVQNLEAGAIARDELAEFVSVVVDLAAYPQPDPGCRVLVVQACRRLVELLQALLEKARFNAPVSASWAGSALHGAMLDELHREVSARNVPVDWVEPRFSAVGGAVVLAAAARALQSDTPLAARIDSDVWREVFALSDPLPDWKE